MSSFSWEYTYSFYQSYFLFHLQDFLDFSEADSIHSHVQTVDVAQDFKAVNPSSMMIYMYHIEALNMIIILVLIWPLWVVCIHQDSANTLECRQHFIDEILETQR